MTDDGRVADLGELDETARALEAAELSRRAEKLYAEGDLGGALAQCKRALELDPSMAEYLGFHGYLLGLGGASGASLREGLGELEQAIARDPHHAQMLCWRGVLHRRLGNEAEAVADFKRAAEVDPQNIDAQRELRGAPGAPQLKALERTPTKAPITAKVTAVSVPARARSRRVPPAVLALLVFLLGLAGTFGVPWLTAYLRRPPPTERMVRMHLLENEIDHALGPAHDGPYEHETALDEMGPTAVAVAIQLLADGRRAENEKLRSTKTVRELANAYLVHYAEDVAKKPPPSAATASSPDWTTLGAAWAAWQEP